MSDLAQAVSCLEAGDWQAAHRIVQPLDSELACWAHGIVHLMEGDEVNARYWYRRIDRDMPSGAPGAIEREISALRAQIE